MADRAYSYVPLPRYKQTIRLVRLLPPGPNGEIRLALELKTLHTSGQAFAQQRDSRPGPSQGGASQRHSSRRHLLRSSRRYTAISYTWGLRAVQRKAWIHGKYVMLRENIWNFLSFCSTSGFQTPGLMWIDSICIDQANIPEKNDQVRVMGEIFREAERVLVWLGEDSVKSQLARIEGDLSRSGHSLEDLIFPNDDRKERRRRDDGMSLTKPQPAYAADDMMLHVPISDDLRKHIVNHDRALAIAELAHIFSSHYWRRVWIVQEVVLSSEPAQVVTGMWTIDMDILVTLEQEFGYYFRHRIPVADRRVHFCQERHLSSIWSVQEDIGWFHSGDSDTRPDLTDLLEKFSKQDSTDPRDGVYALIGMTQWNQKFDIDYSCSTLELYVKALRCLAEESCVPHRPGRAGLPCVPSGPILQLTRALGMDKEQLSILLEGANTRSITGLHTDFVTLWFFIPLYCALAPTNHGDVPNLTFPEPSIDHLESNAGVRSRTTDLHDIQRCLPSKIEPRPNPKILFVCNIFHYLSILVRCDKHGLCLLYSAYARGKHDKPTGGPLSIPPDVAHILRSRFNEQPTFWDRMLADRFAGRGFGGQMQTSFTPYELLKLIEFDLSVASNVDSRDLYPETTQCCSRS